MMIREAKGNTTRLAWIGSPGFRFLYKSIDQRRIKTKETRSQQQRAWSSKPREEGFDTVNTLFVQLCVILYKVVHSLHEAEKSAKIKI